MQKKGQWEKYVKQEKVQSNQDLLRMYYICFKNDALQYAKTCDFGLCVHSITKPLHIYNDAISKL